MDNDGYFVITRVHRDDLEAAGFDTSNVTDDMMEDLAKKMANDYLNQLFWSSLEIIAEECLGIPKKEDLEDRCDGDGICLELPDGTEVELVDTWRIENGDSYDLVEIWDTNTNHVIGSYRGTLPDIDDEDFDMEALYKKVEEAIKNFNL